MDGSLASKKVAPKVLHNKAVARGTMEWREGGREKVSSSTVCLSSEYDARICVGGERSGWRRFMESRR